MTGIRIAEAARQTGFTESALRFYEQEGVVIPERTVTGYRSYSPDDLESLQFVARAKRLGPSLDLITDLLGLLDQDECRPVQDRLAVLVADRIARCSNEILRSDRIQWPTPRAASWLGQHTPIGACDEDCGCKSDARTMTIGRTGGCDDDCGCASHGNGTLIQLGASPDIVCSLDSGEVEESISAWQSVLATANGRQPLSNGVTVVFHRNADAGRIAALAAAEQTCCQFFNFGIRVDSNGVYLDVGGPIESSSSDRVDLRSRLMKSGTIAFVLACLVCCLPILFAIVGITTGANRSRRYLARA